MKGTLWALLGLILILGLTSTRAWADPNLPLQDIPVSGDQDGSETPFIRGAPGFDLLRNVQTFRVPGTGPVDLTFDFVYREALYDNEFGYFKVDGSDGTINGAHPGDAGYLPLLLERATVVFASGSGAGTPDVTNQLTGGDILAFFIVQDDTLANLDAHNPSNDSGESPLMFFSLDRSNPDGVDHFVGFRNVSQSITQFAFEDATDGGDRDYNDIVFNVRTVLRPSASIEPRSLVYIQGIHSESRCPDGFAQRIAWINNHLASDRAVETRLDLEFPPTYFSYSGSYCQTNALMPDYQTFHTCGREDDLGNPAGIPGLALRLKSLIDQQDDKVTVVGHSMGGLITAFLVGFDPDWAREHVASVVTFDSPLRGLPRVNANALILGGPCSILDPTVQDMIDLLPGVEEAVLAVAADAAGIVPFYTIDATGSDLAGQEYVPGGRTDLDGERDHIRTNDDHTSVWEGATDSKKRLIVCAVLAAFGCNFETLRVVEGATASGILPVGSGIDRVSFVSSFGSTIEMSLVAPDGTTYGPNGAGPIAGYSVTATSEVYEIDSPLAGTWNVRLNGISVAGSGEDVEVGVLVDSVSDAAIGDVSCDARVSSIDAAITLQFFAGLLHSLPCRWNGDANGDGTIDAVDALLELQLDAGLIGHLPP